MSAPSYFKQNDQRSIWVKRGLYTLVLNVLKAITPPMDRWRVANYQICADSPRILSQSYPLVSFIINKRPPLISQPVIEIRTRPRNYAAFPILWRFLFRYFHLFPQLSLLFSTSVSFYSRFFSENERLTKRRATFSLGNVSDFFSKPDENLQAA